MKQSMKRIALVGCLSILGVLLTHSFLWAKSSKTISGVVNINTASASQLMLLPGIGKGKASAILDYRKEHPFSSARDLIKVPGIGEALFKKFENAVVVQGETTARLPKAASRSKKPQQK